MALFPFPFSFLVRVRFSFPGLASMESLGSLRPNDTVSAGRIAWVPGAPVLHPAQSRWADTLGRISRRRSRTHGGYGRLGDQSPVGPLMAAQPHEDEIEHWCQEDAEKGHADHAAEHCRA